MTFRVESSILHYRSNGKVKRSLTSVSLRFRTRQSTATLLHAQKGSDYLTVSLQDSHMVMELHAGDKNSPKVTVQAQHPVSDGEWHTAKFSMENQTLLSSRWLMTVDGRKTALSISKTAVRHLDFLKEGADIFLGGLGLDTDAKLFGCLGSVQIGGLLLPFYLDTQLKLPRPQDEQFVRINSDITLQYGCLGDSVCAPNPCENEGVCEDRFDLHHCVCPSEWTGPLCEDMADACISSPCIIGHCTNVSGGFKCVCELGYSGEQCDMKVDTCETSNCSNGATCLTGFLGYTCLCPQNMTGQYCE